MRLCALGKRSGDDVGQRWFRSTPARSQADADW
ncbi:Uncharacterised protein [Vibrio cholerae]|nr:Uncharacterised protein [Vibrio cholerae]